MYTITAYITTRRFNIDMFWKIYILIRGKAGQLGESTDA